MAARASFLLLALLGAALFLQVAVANEDIVVDGADSFITSRATDLDVDEDAEVADVNEADATNLNDDDAEFEDSTVEDPEAATDDPDAKADYAEGVEQSEASDLVEDSEVDEVLGAELNPLARILRERSSKRCWSKKNCKRFFKKPGCCKKKCVNLLQDSTNCGKCRHRCNTKKGYVCHNGYCKKPKKPKPPKHGCGGKKCLQGKVCCGKGCKDLRNDGKNCGKCGTMCKKGRWCCKGRCVDKKVYHHCGKCGVKCPFNRKCCYGKCTNISKDPKHCGKCGVKCPFGRKCCYEKCTNISKDPKHCGRCNKPCAHGTKCVFGMCGYGL